MSRTSPESPMPIELKEAEKEQPNLTVFLMRHGESESDKTKPSRGLTEKGRGEVTENFNELINQIIKDELPDFADFDKPEERQKAANEALAKVEIHLADSQTDRTMEQAWQERKMLIDIGVKTEHIYLSRPTYEWAQKKGLIEVIPETGAGSGIKKRLAGVKGVDQTPAFRKQIDSPDYQQKVGATDTLSAWALTPEDQIPDGIEKRSEMQDRLRDDLGLVERRSTMLQKYPKRVVYVANSHGSILSLTASSELDVPIEQLGTVAGGEGVRLDFYGSGKQREAKPFGNNLKAKVAELKTK